MWHTPIHACACVGGPYCRTRCSVNTVRAVRQATGVCVVFGCGPYAIIARALWVATCFLTRAVVQNTPVVDSRVSKRELT